MRLKTRAVRGVAWVAGGAWARQILNFLANIALMRLIAPEAFGQLALAMFFLTLVRKLFGFGFNHAFIHRQQEPERAAPTHLALHVAVALIVIAAAIAARPALALRYDDATATAFIVLAIFAILENASQTARLLLEKELDFARLVRLDVVVIVVSNLAAIALAALGAGLGALLGKQAIAWLIQAAGSWRLAPPMPGRVPDLATARWYLRFGAPMWIAGMATFVSLQFDDFLVGSLDSAEALGYYARAYALACFPTAMVTHIVARVAFPLYARVQDDRARLSLAFTQVLRFVVTFTTPMGVGLAVVAPEAVPLVFGDTWRPMVPIVRLLLIYACLRPLYDDCGELFTAVGRPDVSSRILVLQAVVVIALCPPAVYLFGAKGAAVAVGLAMAAGVVKAYRVMPRFIEFEAASVFAPAFVAAAVATAAAYGSLAAVAPSSAIAILFVKGGAFAVVYAALLYAMEGKTMRRDARTLMQAWAG